MVPIYTNGEKKIKPTPAQITVFPRGSNSKAEKDDREPVSFALFYRHIFQIITQPGWKKTTKKTKLFVLFRIFRQNKEGG